MARRRRKWIAGAIGKKGALHRALGIPEDEHIPTGLLHKVARAGGKLAREARLALTLRGFRHHHGHRK